MARKILAFAVWLIASCLPQSYVVTFALRARAVCQWAIAKGIL